MNIEDEILSLVEKRESELMKARHELEVAVTQLNDTNAVLDEKNAQLNEQKEQLDEKNAQLRATIRMLLNLGKSPTEIADSLGMDLADVQLLASTQ